MMMMMMMMMMMRGNLCDWPNEKEGLTKCLLFCLGFFLRRLVRRRACCGGLEQGERGKRRETRRHRRRRQDCCRANNLLKKNPIYIFIFALFLLSLLYKRFNHLNPPFSPSTSELTRRAPRRVPTFTGRPRLRSRSRNSPAAWCASNWQGPPLSLHTTTRGPWHIIYAPLTRGPVSNRSPPPVTITYDIYMPLSQASKFFFFESKYAALLCSGIDYRMGPK